MRSRPKYLCVNILVALCILFLANYVLSPLIIGIPRLESVCRPRFKSGFNVDKWKSASYDSGVRYIMANGLLANDKLVGLSKEQVIELLGNPTRRSTNNVDEELLHYELASQQQYPASFWLYPRLFPNVESWVLIVKVNRGSVVSGSIIGS